MGSCRQDRTFTRGEMNDRLWSEVAMHAPFGKHMGLLKKAG